VYVTLHRTTEGSRDSAFVTSFPARKNSPMEQTHPFCLESIVKMSILLSSLGGAGSPNILGIERRKSTRSK
jgi:hypothetical protein